MEFIDEETRPRFLFQSRSPPSSATEPENPHQNKPLIFISISISLLLLVLTIFFFQSEIFRSLSLWFFISFLIGPFAPLSLTGGVIRVGQGKIVEFLQPNESNLTDESKKKVPSKRQKGKRSDELGFNSNVSLEYQEKVQNSDRNTFDSTEEVKKLVDFGANSKNWVNGSVNLDREEEGFEGNSDGFVIDERKWTELDMELLKKQILKHPVGKPRRWELITDSFKGRHTVQSVIKMAKSMGEAKPEDSDSYSKFLRNRKPVDKRVENGNGEFVDGDERKRDSGVEISSWSSGEDIALLNALKAFPKDVPMRWEKIAAAVPAKTKAACMKRVSELKRDFRSSKSPNGN